MNFKFENKTYFSDDNKYISQSPLSNFYVLDKPLIYNNREYITSEHLYQSLRYLNSINSIDLEYAEIIRKSPTANYAKFLGNQFITDNSKKPQQWKLEISKIVEKYQKIGLSKIYLDNNSVHSMKIALQQKFTQNQKCKNALLSTEEIIEFRGDYFWGIQYVANKVPNSCREHIGDNNLGKLLVEIKSNLC